MPFIQWRFFSADQLCCFSLSKRHKHTSKWISQSWYWRKRSTIFSCTQKNRRLAILSLWIMLLITVIWAISKALVIIHAIFLLYCDLKCSRNVSVCTFRLLCSLHYPISSQLGNYETNARFCLSAHMHYLNFIMTSLRKCYHNADNFAKPIPIFNSLCSLFLLSSKQTLIMNVKR